MLNLVLLYVMHIKQHVESQHQLWDVIVGLVDVLYASLLQQRTNGDEQILSLIHRHDLSTHTVITVCNAL